MGSGNFDAGQLELAPRAEFAADPRTLGAGEDEAGVRLELQVAVGAARAGRHHVDLKGGAVRRGALGHDVEGEAQRLRLDAGEGADAQDDEMDAAGPVAARLREHGVHRRGHDSDFVHDWIHPSNARAARGPARRMVWARNAQ